MVQIKKPERVYKRKKISDEIIGSGSFWADDTGKDKCQAEEIRNAPDEKILAGNL